MIGFKQKNKKEGIFQGVLMAYLILILHVGLIMGLGLLVFFFSGLIQYMGWIFIFGTVAVLGSGYYFYRRMKEEGKNLKEMIRMPLLSGKAVEVSLLGGLASFRVGPAGTGDRPLLSQENASPTLFLENSPGKTDLESLKEWAKLLQEGFITREEFDVAKDKLLSK
jgi:hypothetical protein